MQPAILNRIILYVKDQSRVAEFYCRYFGFEEMEGLGEGTVHLHCPSGGCSITLFKAAKSLKTGQSAIKMVFAVENVEAMKADCAEQGLEFGKTWKYPTYEFANARDPAGNLVQISSRQFS